MTHRLLRRRRFSPACVLALLLLAGGVLAAADISGKWTAETPSRDGKPEPSTFDLTVSGETVTGTVTMAATEYAIKDGTLRGNDLRFHVVVNMGRDVKFLYAGTVSGDEIGFVREIEGMGRKATFVAKRAQ